MDDIRQATVIELAGANLIIRAGVLNGTRGFTMARKGRRLISEPPRGNNSHRCARCDNDAVQLSSMRTTHGNTSALSTDTPGPG